MDLYKDGNIQDKLTINYKLKCERSDDTIELKLYDENFHKWVQHHVISLQKLIKKTILSKLTKDELLNLQELINDILREKRQNMYFKTCKYYKQAEQQEHCPFSAVCGEACIFTYTDNVYRCGLDDIVQLQEENELLKSRLKDREQELNNYTMSLDNRNETIKIMCDIIAKLLISARIKKVDKYIEELEESYQDEIKDKVGILANP